MTNFKDATAPHRQPSASINPCRDRLNILAGQGVSSHQAMDFNCGERSGYPVELLFPKKESHFDGLELQSDLSKKQNVKILKTAYIHGFMNSRSANYSPTGYSEQLNWLRLNGMVRLYQRHLILFQALGFLNGHGRTSPRRLYDLVRPGRVRCLYSN